jgi:hypothetical protein
MQGYCVKCRTTSLLPLARPTECQKQGYLINNPSFDLLL